MTQITHAGSCPGLSSEYTQLHMPGNSSGFSPDDTNYTCGQLSWFEFRVHEITHAGSCSGLGPDDTNYTCGQLSWFEFRVHAITHVDSCASLIPDDTNYTCGQLC